MVNEELSAKSLHFVVDYAVKPTAKEIIKSLEKICLASSSVPIGVLLIIYFVNVLIFIEI